MTQTDQIFMSSTGNLLKCLWAYLNLFENRLNID